MPSINLTALAADSTDGALQTGEHIAIHVANDAWRAVVLEAGMASGEPSVAFIVPVPGQPGAVAVLETSLAILRAAMRGLEGMAETHFGWTPPS